MVVVMIVVLFLDPLYACVTTIPIMVNVGVFAF